MSPQFPRFRRPRLRPRLRRGARGTAVAAAAMALLTASQASGVVQEMTADRHDEQPVSADGPLPEVDSQGDDSYHTELPPLKTVNAPPQTYTPARVRAESGIPATVLAAYRRAEASVAGTDPGCRLPWQLLAAIGKVESGQARGGAVDARGDTLGRITGPPLNGNGFALIRDTDKGAWDGDTVYDRAVGPMQFLPSTWRRWGADGNGDGRANPNNIFDAALAAGHYLCAGGRDLRRPADLERAVLSYNYSREYLQLILYWLEFYREGVHTVPDGKGVIPDSPGAGGKTPATRPVGGGGGGGGDDGKGGGIVIGPDPTRSPTPSPTPHPTPDPTDSPTGSPSPSPSPTDSQQPTDPGTPPTDPPTDPPTSDPGTTPCPTDSASPPADPSGEPTPTPGNTGSPSPCATPGT
ncbi:lytic transglycosylase domain-containing protein [Streptomyces sp. NPDC058001]|uniref:lytic transglycosylase domain-containing protein n=1 Tax=Streptomyces sp. NPDC058001 TaxID=3346300 RepID=UPI0036E17D94